jgi:signal transduction histidine kinase
VSINAKQLENNIQTGEFMVVPDVLESVTDSLKCIVDGAQKIETFAKFALRNITRDKRKRKPLFLNDIAIDVFDYFKKSLKERNIDINLIGISPRVSAILGFPIDWESVFVNFVTNSVWALRNTKAAKRKIRVVIGEVENQIEIRFADSGQGLEEGTEDKIFLPTFSTKRNEKGEVIGTGMGLTIVKGFVEDYEGAAIYVESPCDLGGAQFRIRIPIPKISRRGRKGG